MKRLLFLLAITLACFSCNNTPSDTDWPEIKTEHKPFTRWWWLGNAVDRENLTRTLEEFSRAGIGGVEIASIYGIHGEESREIDYLSDEWMAMYTHAVAEADRLGLSVDLTNGTGWPFGGPHVSWDDAATRLRIVPFDILNLGPEERLRVEFPIKELPPHETHRTAPDHITLNKIMAYGPSGEILELTDRVDEAGIFRWEAPASGWHLYAAFDDKTGQVAERTSPGGGGLVVDHFNRAAVERYFAPFDEAFARSGAPAPRMFFNDSYEVERADWTPDFFPQFERRRGYKLENHLPAFLANDTTELSRRVVADYRQTIDELLKDNFITPWLTWAHARGAQVRNQSHGSPGNLIDIYAMVDVPECETFGRTAFDIPGLQVDPGMRLNDGTPAVLKFASSAAHISGKPLTSAETFTWLTEHFRTALSQCKPEIDQMFAAGVNHVFFHGSPYSPQDAPWPGWLFYASVNLSPTNPIWADAPAFFDYIARCQSFLQQGSPDNDLLLYFPIHDFWNNHRGSPFMPLSIHNMVRIIPQFNQTVEDILDAGYDLDYISDTFIASLRVEQGTLVTSGGTSYQALVVPDNRYIPVETLEKLLALAEQGATILFAERYPADVPGLSDLESRRTALHTQLSRLPGADFGTPASVHPFGRGQLITGSSYPEMLRHTQAAPEPFKRDFGGQYTRRATEDGHIYFLSMLRNAPLDGWVTLSREARSAMLFDPMTGAKGAARLRQQEGLTQVYLQLRPGESVILRTFTDKKIHTDNWPYLRPSGTPVNIDRNWSLSFVQSEPAIEGTFAIDTLLDWTALPHENATLNMGTALYRTTFTLPEAPAADWQLDLGRLHESAKVRINGRPAATIYALPYTARVGRYLHEGENTIEVEVTNLPANRIRDYDRRGIAWRKFKEINFVNIFYKKVLYDDWETTPSGLPGPVTLTPMEAVIPE